MTGWLKPQKSERLKSKVEVAASVALEASPRPEDGRLLTPPPQGLFPVWTPLVSLPLQV